ncbi:carcinoembryonic antigen-related cell adhesion molecule 1-like isoform X1 [Alosa alosa]|uniref:carcinoembryonic antigen-related cell adhesion molecule 1-like isoform X1 n=1 Tax=Alosa alosa TaxID=278164 RepID=UPI002015094B|nr:carcinoembryonic antigen-related cell adhesion molecule 1-like isoform X1 [Alosa alosa]
MDSHTLLTLWILAAVGLCSCQDEFLLDGPLNRTVGGNVVFTLIHPPSTPPSKITWISPSNIEIITTLDHAEKIHPDYNGRISLNKTTASLELSNLTPNDTGEYTLDISINSVPQQAKTSLTVFVNISNVRAEADQNELVEFNSSVTLTCSASGTLPSFRWFNGSTNVTGSDRVLLGYSNLTILNVTRYDDGPFKCEASNMFSDHMSSDVYLTIHYGPDSAVFSVTPDASNYSSGSDITLSCSSESKPAARFQWALNGTFLGREGKEIVLENVQTSQSGAYSCWAYNSKTQRYKTSSPTTITVIETIAGVAITRSGNTLIAGESSVNLTCDAQGFIVDREWTKDGKPLSLSNRTTFYEKNRTLSISPVETEDSGQYTCIVSNPVSSGRDDFELVVNLAPDPGVGVGGFPTWAIAVIVIAVLIVLVIPVILVLKKKGKICPPKSREAPAKDNSPMELNYADISHFQRKNVQRVDQGNGGNRETLYSGVRLPSSPAGPTSGQGPTYADINFQNNTAGMRATLGHGGNVGDQSTVYAAVKPKGQAPGPPRQVPDVTYAQVKK